MSENLILMEKSTNLKPDNWYKEYVKLYGTSTLYLKDRDIRADKNLDFYQPIVVNETYNILELLLMKLIIF